MADDISKNITIQVTAETDKLEQSINNLGKIISNLKTRQEQLASSGKTLSSVFKNNADKIALFEQSLQAAQTKLSAFQATLNAAAASAKASQSAFSSLTSATSKHAKSMGDAGKQAEILKKDIGDAAGVLDKQKSAADKSQSSTAKHAKSMGDSGKQAKSLKKDIADAAGAISKQKSAADKGQNSTAKHAKSMGDGAKQAKNLKSGVSGVTGALGTQKSAADKSKLSFDLHKATSDHLKQSFSELKSVAGSFGPTLEKAATGFNVMKSGLSIVQGGLKGVGEAIEADGFGFLLNILQDLFNAFVHSSEGTKIFQGVLSAIGVVFDDISSVIGYFKNILIDALSHPLDSIKELGRMIMENIINHFTAFGKILHGLLHLDFKEVANGAIQAVTGISDATDKAGKVFETVKKGTEKVVGQMVTSFKQGYNDTGKASDDATAKVVGNIKTQQDAYDKYGKTVDNVNKKIKEGADNTNQQPASPAAPAPKIVDANDNGDANEFANETQGMQTAIDAKEGQQKIADAKKTADAITKYGDQKRAEDEKKKEADRKALNKKIEDEAKQSAQKIATDALNVLQNSIKQQTEAKIAALENDKAAELNNSALTSSQRLAITQKYKNQEDAVKKKAFKEEQEVSIAQAVINGALAVTKATSQTGVLSPLVVPEIIAETAVEIAKIAAQKPPAYAKGGLHYASDGKGGVLPGYSRTDNVNAYLRSGEGIVVSEAMRDPWARSMVSAINVGFGGRDFASSATGRGFAVGGIFTDGGNANRYYNQPVTDNKNLANTIAYQMINNFPPVYVDVKDINTQQNILAQTINRVTI